MPDQKYFFTRREFLRTAAVAGSSAFFPAFLGNTIRAAVGPDTLKSPLKNGSVIPGFKDDRILVVLQLGGGNDGLNTIIPFGDDAYYQSRPTLGIKSTEVLNIDGYMGFHKALKGLRSLYDEGKVAIINGVGYPNPNRSHFRSMEIWHTASDSDTYLGDGWIGRYFDNCCSGDVTAEAGVAVGQIPPQAFDGSGGLGVAFQNPDRFKWIQGVDSNSDESFRKLNKIGTQTMSDDQSSIDFLRHTTANIVLSSDRVVSASRKKRPDVDYPNTPLGRDFRTVSDMIAADLPTRIYYVSFTGFDTHANQLGMHERLLGQVSEALSAFYRDLKKTGLSDRVIIMAFSEFGRRMKENASRGSDHGTAAPMFVIGDPVKPGLYGKYPSLTSLEANDLKHNVDFRQVYASLLEQWFNIDSQIVLGNKFQTAQLIRV